MENFDLLTWSSQSPQFQILGIISDSSLFGLSATNKISQSRGVAFGFARTAFFVVLTLHLPGLFFQKWPSIFASIFLLKSFHNPEKKIMYSKFLKLLILFSIVIKPKLLCKSRFKFPFPSS